jgi:hypothetical protein
MIRELNNNKYKVEKANYDDIVMDIDLSDEEGSEMAGGAQAKSLNDKEKDKSSTMINLDNILGNPAKFGLA